MQPHQVGAQQALMVMRGYDHPRPHFCRMFQKQRHDGFGGVRVKGRSRFIRQHEGRTVGQREGDCYALTLAYRKGCRTQPQNVAQTQPFDQAGDPGGVWAFGDGLGQGNVFLRRQEGHQPTGLRHKAKDRARAACQTGRARHRAQRFVKRPAS